MRRSFDLEQSMAANVALLSGAAEAVVLVPLVMWVLCSVAGGVLGARKNRAVTGLLLGFFLGIFGLIILSFIEGDTGERQIGRRRRGAASRRRGPRRAPGHASGHGDHDDADDDEFEVVEAPPRAAAGSGRAPTRLSRPTRRS
jgi:hypothetical protein